MNEKPQPEDRVGDASQSGMFAMMAMMMVCCVAVLVLLALIPFIGWPAGAFLGIGLGAALMYAHMKMMNHGSHHQEPAQPQNPKGIER